jgi:hypothetical protein
MPSLSVAPTLDLWIAVADGSNNRHHTEGERAMTYVISDSLAATTPVTSNGTEPKLEIAYRFEATMTESIPIGLTPEGIRFDNVFDGLIVEGPHTGARVHAVDPFLMRPDGVGVIDAYELISTTNGEHITARVRGYVVPPAGLQLPPPDVLLSPDFQWPDIDFPLHGFVLASTSGDELAWMNRTAFAIEGTFNMASRQLKITGRYFVPAAG